MRRGDGWLPVGGGGLAELLQQRGSGEGKLGRLHGSRWIRVQLFLVVVEGTAEKTPTAASRVGGVGVIP